MARTMVLTCMLAVAFASTAWAAEIAQIAPSKDNTLYESATGSTSNGAGQYFFVGRSDDSDLKRAVIAFDIAGNIPTGATILDVRLTLRMSKTQVGNQTVALRRLLKNWGEGTSNAGSNEGGGAPSTPGDATWIHTFYSTQFWTTPGGDFVATNSATASVGGVNFYTWGSTPQMVADVQGWLDTPATNFGWLLLGPEQVRSAKRFDSRENPTPANRPVLRVEYEPVTILPGDVNCDTKVDFGDINPFVLILTNPAGWQAMYPNCPFLNGDINQDGFVDFGDINPFVRLLTNP